MIKLCERLRQTLGRMMASDLFVETTGKATGLKLICINLMVILFSFFGMIIFPVLAQVILILLAVTIRFAFVEISLTKNLQFGKNDISSETYPGQDIPAQEILRETVKGTGIEIKVEILTTNIALINILRDKLNK